jgi:glycosyltransferase involved in cell wall biosynthesis
MAFKTMIQNISILIPAYNAEVWIESSVYSALAQHAMEVVVLDDGSTDRTGEILEMFGSKIRVEKGDRAGGNAARNRLLALSRGSWIQYLDADDYLALGKIANQLRALSWDERERVDVIYSPVLIEQWSGARKVGEYVHAIDTGLDIFTQWLLWQMPQTGGALWRKSALEKIGGWNENMRCCQEHELYFRGLQAGLRFRYAPPVGACYRLWSEDTVSRRNVRQLVEVRTQLILDFIVWLRREGLVTAQHRKAAGQMIFEMARRLAQENLDTAARYYQENKKTGFIFPKGAAAPWKYRVALQAGGFRFAETLATALR